MRLFGLGSSHSKITASMAVSLTERGKKVAVEYISKGANFAILSALAERTPQTVSDLSHETSVDIDEVKARLKILGRQGLVRMTGIED